MLKLLFVFSFIGLTGSAIAQKGFTIHAKISGFPDGTKFYLENREIQTIIDSTVIRSDEFQMKGSLGEIPKQLGLIAVNGEESYRYGFCFIADEEVSITGSRKDFDFLTVKGSRHYDVYQKFYDQVLPWYKRRGDLFNILMQQLVDTTPSGKAWARSFYKTAISSIDSITEVMQMSFIQSYLNSYAALHELSFFKVKVNKDTLRRMYDRLNDVYKESPDGMRLLTYLEVGDPLKKGDMLFDFEAIDTSGKKYQLSAFKGKYILLDFTQAYCAPCVQSVEELKKMNSLYKDKLAIISFSADLSKDVWYKTVLRDKPSWLSLWDGKGSFARPVLKYNVTGYPTFTLINPDGKIVWMGSGYGDGMFAGLLPKYIK